MSTQCQTLESLRADAAQALCDADESAGTPQERHLRAAAVKAAQIYDAAKVENAARPWCVVLEPGMADEYVEATQHATHAKALRWVEEARNSGQAADVAKRLPDGSLTYEF